VSPYSLVLLFSGVSRFASASLVQYEMSLKPEGYRLNYIRAKRADTSFAWINSIFLVMNLLILLRIFFALCKRGAAVVRMPLLQMVERLVRYQLAHDTRRRGYLYQMATS